LGRLADLVREGLQISDATYEATKQFIAQTRARLVETYRTSPIILVPAATGPAPEGISSTGDRSMNTPWSALGTPAISVPLPVGNDLPLGLQLTAAPRDDVRVLRTAVSVWNILKP